MKVYVISLGAGLLAGVHQPTQRALARASAGRAVTSEAQTFAAIALQVRQSLWRSRSSDTLASRCPHQRATGGVVCPSSRN